MIRTTAAAVVVLTISFLAFVSLASSCSSDSPQYAVDPVLQEARFQACLAAVPEGLSGVVLKSDWDDVVDSCDNVARRQAERCVKNCPVLPPGAPPTPQQLQDAKDAARWRFLLRGLDPETRRETERELDIEMARVAAEERAK